MILAGDETLVQFAKVEICPHLSGPRGSRASLEGRCAFGQRAGRNRLQAPAVYPGEIQALACVGGAFAVQRIPSEP